MQPAKPSTNITPPTTRNSQTGSKPPKSVMDDRLESTPCREKGAEGEERVTECHSATKDLEAKIKPHQRNRHHWPDPGSLLSDILLHLYPFAFCQPVLFLLLHTCVRLSSFPPLNWNCIMMSLGVCCFLLWLYGWI